MMTNSEIERYIKNHTTPEAIHLAELNRETNLKILYPRMLSGHVQGKFLEMISCMIRPKMILEIGTYTGYSAICLAKGLTKEGVIHTIEINPELENFSKIYFRKAGLEHNVKQYIGNAIDIISLINKIFDLVFIDADKENYLNYYNLVFDKVRKGGFILADNALWDGKVVKPVEQGDKETEGIIKFNDFVQNDNRVENILFPLRDGIMMIRKI